MNVKSMLVGFLIAVVASTGAYFLLPPPRGAEASNCATAHAYAVQVGFEVLGNKIELYKDITHRKLSDHDNGVQQLLAMSSSNDANLVMYQNIMNTITEMHSSLLKAMIANR
jgi:hypothetical protein